MILRKTAIWLAVLALMAGCDPVQRNNANEPKANARQIDIKVVTSAPYMHISVRAYDQRGDFERFGPSVIAAGLNRPFESNIRYDAGAGFTVEVRAGVDWVEGYVFTIRCHITEGLASLSADGPITVRSNRSESEVFCKYTRVGS